VFIENIIILIEYILNQMRKVAYNQCKHKKPVTYYGQKNQIGACYTEGCISTDCPNHQTTVITHRDQIIPKRRPKQAIDRTNMATQTNRIYHF
jgi:hypothetical protein